MKILITGASGFVGGNLALLLAKNHQIFAHYNSNTPEQRISKKCKIIKANLCNLEECKQLLAKCQPECIVHCAASAKVVDCQKNPTKTQKLNVEGCKNLISCIEESQRKPLFIFCSTDLVFEGAKNINRGFLETQKPKPISVYAKSKVEAEKLFNQATFPNSTFRLSLVYGPRVNNTQGFLSWMRSRLESGTECDLLIDEFRTPVCTKDIAQAVESCIKLNSNKNQLPKIVNIAGPQRVSRKEFGLYLCAHANYPKSLITESSQKTLGQDPPRPEDVSLDSTLLATLLNRAPLDIQEGLKFCEIPEH